LEAYNILKKLYYFIKINNFKSFNRNLKYFDEATEFINKGNFYSSSPYLIWVDTKNFKTNIFKGSKNKWTLINSYLCTIGKPWSPTIKGIFYAGVKGFSFGENRGFRCFYYTQIKDNYLFHSIVYYLDGTIKDDRLGMQLTDGCVRLATKDAKWIYDNIPTGTTIFIN
jgi:lipoprotein-anchoring transpeptidase ErfK/SrfK